MKSLSVIALAATLVLATQGARQVAHAEPPAGVLAVSAAPKTSPAGPAQNGASYYVPYITDSAGNAVPILQIPSSVVVIPRQVIDDQQDITVCGALRNVSGVICR